MDYIGKTDFLVVNEVEAEFLSGIKIEGIDTAEQAARVLMNRGTNAVIITLGSQGSMAFRKDEKYFVPAYKVDAVDTTAAGDVFCGSLAVAIIEGKSLENAIRFANAAAALSVTKMGAQPSAPKRKEIEDFIIKH
jgi:ribokinase